jgi:hypothetical protein
MLRSRRRHSAKRPLFSRFMIPKGEPMQMNRLLLAAVFFASSACGALAEPITYKFTVQGPGQGPVPGFTGTLGGVAIGGGDDVLTFTFVADTLNVQPFSVPGAHGWVNPIGTGSFSVLDLDTEQVVAEGSFLPSDDIFVSVDNQNGGIGFGSNYTPPGGPNPFPGNAAYPLGIEFSTATTQYDLQSEIGIFGSGSLSCAGFPGACMAPPSLATTAGDLVLNSGNSPDGTFVAEFTPGGGGAAPIPESSTWAMMGLGFAGLGFATWRGARTVAARAA